MKKFVIALGMISLTFTASARAFTVSDKCGDLLSCAKAFSELLGENYLYDIEFRGKVESSPKFEVTRENAEETFTHILYLAGFTRVPLQQAKIFSIMRQRDARDSATPIFDATQKLQPVFPRIWDIASLKYKAAHPNTVEPMARSLRSFLPAGARIIPNELSNTVIVTDTIPNLKKSYAMLKDMDVKPSAEVRKAWAARERESRALRDASKTSHSEE